MKQSLINKFRQNTGFFKEIPKQEFIRLIRLTRKVEIEKDEYFLKAGDVAKQIAYVRSGIVRLFYLDRLGKDVTKHFSTEHTLAISYNSFIQRIPSRLSIQALENTVLYTIDYKTYYELLETHPFWQISARKLAEMIFLLKEKKEAELLLDDAQTRYMQFLNDYPNLINRVKQYYISSYLGIAPESLSRIRANIK